MLIREVAPYPVDHHKMIDTAEKKGEMAKMTGMKEEGKIRKTQKEEIGVKKGRGVLTGGKTET